MRKEYIKPEAELVKFVEAEEIMAPSGDLDIKSFDFSNISQTGL